MGQKDLHTLDSCTSPRVSDHTCKVSIIINNKALRGGSQSLLVAIWDAPHTALVWDAPHTALVWNAPHTALVWDAPHTALVWDAPHTALVSFLLLVCSYFGQFATRTPYKGLPMTLM